VFISHDLHVVRYLADRIAVLYLGRLLEIGPAEAVFGGPQHPYTEALLSSVPTLGAQVGQTRIRLSGELPSAASPPSGCVFHTRCPRKLGAICEQQEPPFVDAGEQGDAPQPVVHRIRCHIPVATLRALQSASRNPADEAPDGVSQERSASAPRTAGRNP
jgi:peptide/nickel transport system ATP-binding protein